MSGSGVDLLPLGAQAAVFAGTISGLTVASLMLSASFDAVERALPAGWFESFTKTWPLLGL